MNKEKVLLENLIASKKYIKRKIMEIKRGVIDSDNYYEPLSTRTEKNTLCNSQPSEVKKIETICSSNEDDDDELNSSFEHFFNNKRSTIKRYDKSYGINYDELLDKYYPRTIGLWSLLCEKEPKKTTIEDIENYYNILKTTGIHLKEDGKPNTSKYHKWSVVDHLSSSNAKRSNVNDDKTMENEPFYFNPEANSSMVTDPAVKNMFNFTLTPQPKKGSGLHKDVIPQTQLVYYDDPNELVTRLNLLTSSQSIGNTGVNNEIISILEELREREVKICMSHTTSKGFINQIVGAECRYNK
ncbi:hypothetical protein AGLY_017190 [Aphis glycines]|uniref:DUF8207 domain-containing protein n=1 Tax=Aphis glycines TaxID=307491 RepID=A0A6G0SXL3_APHGL|nr:hypothetical protein AGLY_017190 [Aphis glycines]